jgi:hypothetical protein
MTCSYLSGTPRSPQKHSLYRHAATKLEIYDRSSEKAAWTEPQAPKRQVESSAKPLGTGRIAEDRIAYLAISKTAHKAALSQREAAELSDTISRQGTGRVSWCKGQVKLIEGRGRILALAFPVAADRSTTIWFRMEPSIYYSILTIWFHYSACLFFFRPVPKFLDEGSHVCCLPTSADHRGGRPMRSIRDACWGGDRSNF